MAGGSHVSLAEGEAAERVGGVWWELGIVTLGVILALAAQQWADGRAWAGKARTTREALREELALHYSWSVEWRATLPCMLAQIDRLQRRVVASGATLEPAPVFRNANFAFTVRLPSKEYSRSVYDAALADGVLLRFDPALRRVLNTHYTQVDALTAMTPERRRLSGPVRLSRAIPLDPGVRLQLLTTLDRLRGRIEFMDLQSGQMIDNIANAEMARPPRRRGATSSASAPGSSAAPAPAAALAWRGNDGRAELRAEVANRVERLMR